ncbi:hypothetical protein IWX90DRAFT_155944 [Phyllosticta citrichinensis]|uniref:Uncharacterized protein n=1 Tax=Phyllosticta citrichinensis TaxID=1130410 RepID=A0ABR1XZZ9_9PEZI
MDGRTDRWMRRDLYYFVSRRMAACKKERMLGLPPTPRVQKRARLSCARGREKFSAHVWRPTRVWGVVCVCASPQPVGAEAAHAVSLRSLLGRAQQQNPRIDRQLEWDVGRGWTRFCRPKSPCQVMDAWGLSSLVWLQQRYVTVNTAVAGPATQSSTHRTAAPHSTACSLVGSPLGAPCLPDLIKRTARLPLP